MTNDGQNDMDTQRLIEALRDLDVAAESETLSPADDAAADALLATLGGLPADEFASAAADLVVGTGAKPVSIERRNHLLALVDAELAARRADRTGIQLLLRGRRHNAGQKLVDLVEIITDQAAQTGTEIGPLDAKDLGEIESGVIPLRDQRATNVIALWARAEQLPRSVANDAYSLALRVSIEHEGLAAAGAETPALSPEDAERLASFLSTFDKSTSPRQ